MKNLLPFALFLVIIGSGVFYLRSKWLVNDEPPPRDQLVERLREALNQNGELKIDPSDLNRLQGFIQMDQEDRELQLLHAMVGWRISADSDLTATKKHLFELGSGNDQIALEAMAIISNSRIKEGVQKEDIRKASLKILSHPLSTLEMKLRAGSRAMVMSDPDKRSESIDMVVEELMESNKVELGQWLRQYRAADQILELVSESEALGNVELFFLRFETLLATGKIAEATELVEENQSGLQPKVLAKSRSYLAMANKLPNPAQHFIDWAVENDSMEDLVQGAELALMSRDADVAMKALLVVLEKDPSVITDNQCGQFLQLAIASRNSSQALQIMKVLHDRSPERPGIQNNYLWLQIINAKDSSKLTKLEANASQLVKDYPDQLNFQSTLALSSLLLGNMDSAVQAMEKRGDKNLQHGEKAIHAAALYAKGELEKAKKWDQGLNELRMLPEEWELLQKHRRP